jgi:NAD(P)-dependent dehydrogenase (short-subunit alcohol dehydrogenase family)
MTRTVGTADGKSALVTGASRGIGRAIALALAREGANVAITGRDAAGLAETARGIEAHGRRAVLLTADLQEPGAAWRLAADALAALGRVDILVNNAGGGSGPTTLADGAPEDFDRVQALNVQAPLALLRALGPSMLERGSGSVINVASTLGLLGGPFMGAYAASKATLISLTKTLAGEWGQRGVRVNALLPGPTETELTRALTEDAALRAHYAERTALKRWGTAAEIAEAALFLAGDASSFVTGHALVVDGGITALHP